MHDIAEETSTLSRVEGIIEKSIWFLEFSARWNGKNSQIQEEAEVDREEDLARHEDRYLARHIMSPLLHKKNQRSI